MKPYVQRVPNTCEALAVTADLVEADVADLPGVELADWGVMLETVSGRMMPVPIGNHIVLTGNVENGFAVMSSVDFEGEWKSPDED